MIITVWLLLLIPVLVSAKAAAVSAADHNDEIATTTTRTTALQQDVDELAAQFQKEQGLPGLVVASVAAQTQRNGLRMWTNAYGYANLETKEPMTTDTSLWLASLTKPVVGTILTKAQEQGYLSYETKASEILQNASSFVLGDPKTMPWLEEITLEHLATHRSTIRDDLVVYLCGYYVGESTDKYNLLVDVAGIPNVCIENSPVTLEGFLKAYLSVDGPYYNATQNFLPGVTKPGEQMEYSNIATGLAGYLIELATNTSLPEYANDEIFHVLGMKDTSFRRSDLGKIATPYTKMLSGGEDYTALPIYDLATFPDGGLRSSVNDMALFLGMIMNNGSLDNTRVVVVVDNNEGTAATVNTRINNNNKPVQLLQPESIQEMLRVRPYDGEDGNHAIFWFVTQLQVGGKNRTLIGHNGGDSGAFTFLFFDPNTLTGYFLGGNGDLETLDPIALANLSAALFELADEMAMPTVNGDAEDDNPIPNEEEEEAASSKAIAQASLAFATMVLAISSLLIM